MACYIADRMVERLGRWLRLLGEDVVPAPASAEELFAAAATGRVVLTRDTQLRARLALAGRPVLFIAHDRIEDQLRQVDAVFGLGGTRPLTRCSRCNAVLTFHAPAELGTQVWPHVARTQASLGRCPVCGRIYWKATHLDRMVAFLRRALGRDLLGTS